MNKNKIKHPFEIPKNFFDEFKNEMLWEPEDSTQKGRSRAIKIALNFAKYAAIIVLSFFLGRASLSVFNENEMNVSQSESFTVDEVFLQVTEDDITDFLLEDISIELTDL